jgi:co-chaperonin GroES (HSP10)
MDMAHDTDPRNHILAQLGDLSTVELFHNQVLCAVYVRPEKTQSGIILPGSVRDEDKIQGKAALVVKKGPTAFQDPTGEWFKDMDINLGDWVVFRASDGWSVTINKVLCRIVDDTNVRMRIQNPDQVW